MAQDQDGELPLMENDLHKFLTKVLIVLLLVGALGGAAVGVAVYMLLGLTP